jgi:hypothetical protein
MSDKTRALLSHGSLITIRKYRRQVGGEFATFLDSFWREDEPWVVLRLPSGRRTAVPASWTDLPLGHFSLTKDQAEILPAALPELAQFCQDLRLARKQGQRRKGHARKRK